MRDYSSHHVCFSYVYTVLSELGGPESQSTHCGEAKLSLPLPGIDLFVKCLV